MAHVLQHSVEANFDILRLHQHNPERYPFLLESVVSTPATRYSMLLAFPQQTVRADETGSFLWNLRKHLLRETPQYTLPEGLPFAGGWFVFLDYELSHEIEPVLDKQNRYATESFATRVNAAVIQDKHTETLHFVAESPAQLEQLQADYQQVQVSDPWPLQPVKLQQFSEDAPEKFLKGVERVKDYIVEGDVFQVNLSRQWQGRLAETLPAAALYQQLRQHNPASFAGLAVWQGKEIISSSPERLVQVRDGTIETRPIAGTRARGATADEDARLAKELLAHPKEQAEHIMLIDLERNDMGRVCEYGSVEVNELMVLESYAHVHHIVSNIRGHLRADVLPTDIMRAVFPGGTITGCPKVRCMEIISELEQTPRGAYTGSMGYITHQGEMDLNILIRTIEKQGREFWFRTGAGIVHDSVPEWELKETRFKAQGLLNIFTHD